MPLVPYIPDGYGVARLRFTCVGIGKEVGTTVGVFLGSSDPQTVATAYQQSYRDLVIQDGARLGNSWTFTGVTLTYAGAGGLMLQVEANEVVTGSQGSSNVPPNCCMIVNKRTAAIGRHYRGRFFFPAGVLFEAEVSDAGLITGAIVAGNNTALELWRGEMESDSEPMRLIHYWGETVDSNGDPVSIPQMLPTPITALEVVPLIGTQRRRIR